MNQDDSFDERGRPRLQVVALETPGLALLLTTVLALVLRLFRLGEQSLWVDELLTLSQGTMPGTSLIEQFLDDVQSPLPMLVAALQARALDSELWLRLPGALLGALTVPLLYEVVRRFAGLRAGLFAALLLAVSPMHLDHSQEVRGYAYLLFFGVGTLAAVLESGPKLSWRRWPWILLLGLATCLSNLQGLFWMGGIALGLAVGGRVPPRQWWRWGSCFAAMLVVLAPWWLGSLGVLESARLLPGADTGQQLRGESTWSPWALPYAGFVLVAGRTLGPDTASLHAAEATGRTWVVIRPHLPWIAITGAYALVLVGVAAAKLRRRALLEILAWAAVPVAMAVLLALRNVKPFNPRYVLAALPTLLLLLAVGLDRVGRRRGLLLLLVGLGISGVAIGRHWFDPIHAHEDVRGAAREIAAREGPDDAVLVPTVNLVFGHYFTGTSPSANYSAAGKDSARVAEELASVFPGRRYLWYLRARPWHGDPDGSILAELERRHRRVARHEFVGVTLDLYDRRHAPRSDTEEEETLGSEPGSN